MSVQNTVCAGCRNKKCTNKVESQFCDREGKVQTVTDCAPLRSLLLAQETNNRLLGLQAAVEQLRDQVLQLRELPKAMNNMAEQIESLAAQADLVLETSAIEPKSPRDELRTLPHRGL